MNYLPHTGGGVAPKLDDDSVNASYERSGNLVLR
jgi:hypothetical protein